MENIEMFKWRIEKERLDEIEQTKIAFRIIKEFSMKSKTNDIIYSGSALLDILYNYFEVKGTEDEKILLDLLYKYDFEFSSSIHNAIYYLLEKENELEELRTNPLYWPGMISYTSNGLHYIVKTNLGEINVYRANEIIESPVFDKTLMNQCYERTYEFLKENKDYKAVIALMPYFLEAEKYHTYLAKENDILDIASNAYYEDQKSIDTIFCGEELARLSYEEVEDEFLKLKGTYPNLSERCKLHSLALHYDYNRNR